MSRISRRWLAALVAAAAASLVAPALASATTGAGFDNNDYVASDTTTQNPVFAESDNEQASIAAKGYSVRPFTGIAADDFATALAGAKVLVVPEQANGTLALDLSGAAVNTIRGFVTSGGGLIVNDDASLIDRVFGISVTKTTRRGDL